ncbi:outer membrane protein assembly factor BamD [Candidatus Hydrogenosomobacter endosymbioticus]|nr:outer membrane protein assembly factor BamD [Candidatus Hydrogenosomobacter endosymbioticus]
MLCVCCVAIAGCSQKEKPYVEKPIRDLYDEALNFYKNGKYVDAADAFDEVERQYPSSSWAARAQILSAYSLYKAQKFDRAISTIDTFITLHPASPFICYAYYLRGFCYYTDIQAALFDRESAEAALNSFEELMRRFPASEYAYDAKFKCNFLREHLATQEMVAGRFYMNKKSYVGALKTFASFVEQHPQSCYVPEALYRIVECKIALGLSESARHTASFLGHNFPKSEWYRLCYEKIQKFAPYVTQARNVRSADKKK